MYSANAYNTPLATKTISSRRKAIMHLVWTHWPVFCKLLFGNYHAIQHLPLNGFFDDISGLDMMKLVMLTKFLSHGSFSWGRGTQDTNPDGLQLDWEYG